MGTFLRTGTNSISNEINEYTRECVNFLLSKRTKCEERYFFSLFKVKLSDYNPSVWNFDKS